MPEPMRSKDELQRAHDLLHSIVLGQVPITLSREEQPLIVAALDVLCWALHHDHNQSFALNLALLTKALEDLGYVLEKLDNHDPR